MDFKIVKAEIIDLNRDQRIVKLYVIEDSMFADQIHEIEILPAKENEDSIIKKWQHCIETDNYPKYPATYVLVEDLPYFKEADLYDEECFPFLSNALRVLVRVGSDGELIESPRVRALREISGSIVKLCDM
jgi:hypothetical protein